MVPHPQSSYAGSEETVVLPGTLAVPNIPTADRGPEAGFLARMGAEAFGTFVLVFVGLGLLVHAAQLEAGLLAIALGTGIALTAALASVGHISGQFNPAVTLGLAIAGQLSWRDVFPVWLSQLVGGAVAAAVIFASIPPALFGEKSVYSGARDLFSRTANGFGEHSPIYAVPLGAFRTNGATEEQITEALASGELAAALPVVPMASALLIEVIATAVFVGVALAVVNRAGRMAAAPLVIGLTLAALLMVAGPLTNGSLNPARSFAAAIFSESWAVSQLWLFWVGPLAGAAIAGLAFRVLTSQPKMPELPETEHAMYGIDLSAGTAPGSDDNAVHSGATTEDDESSSRNPGAPDTNLR